jgi:hypothetical protein
MRVINFTIGIIGNRNGDGPLHLNAARVVDKRVRRVNGAVRKQVMTRGTIAIPALDGRKRPLPCQRVYTV